MSAVAADHLRSFVGRIESVESEIADLNADKSDIYKEAKGNGFDVAALREVIAQRRKRGKNAAAFDEREAIVDLYLTTLGEPSLVRAREAAE